MIDPNEARLLQRHIRQLRIGVLALAALLVVGATIRPETLTLRRIVITDDAGRERIVLDASGSSPRPTLAFNSVDGARRITMGEAPDPVVDGRRRTRIAPAWGLLIHDPHGDERGGFSYLDNGRSVISLDRAQGEGVYMTVNERSGFAGLVANYDTGKVGDYAEALRIGTLGRQAFAQAANRDGTPAGALFAGANGRARATDVVQR